MNNRTPSPNKSIAIIAAMVMTCLSLLLFSFGVGAQAVRPAVDVMLVLDKSGSMSQSVPGLGLTKWQVLHESVQAFLIAYRDWGEDADRIGVTYFDHSRSDFPPGGMVDFNPPMAPPLPLTGPGSIHADMTSKFPGGMTCLGGGILAGYSAYDASHDKRIMIIFTDGIQNMEPSVGETAETDMVVADHNVRPDGTGFPTGSLDLKAPDRPFKTHTVAIGDNAVTMLLQNIATAPVAAYEGTSFSLHSMTNLAFELQDKFDQMFVETLAEFSPQLVDIRRIPGNTTTTLLVNNSADKVLIKVVGDPASMQQAQIRIEKDGRNFSRMVRDGGSTFKTFFMDSTSARRNNIQLAGTWTVSVGGPSSQFQISCIVNDESLNATANTGGINYAPGDTITLEAVIESSGGPITDADRVTVLVARPGEDTNDLFAQAGPVDPVGDFPVEPDNDLGQTKYEALIAFDSAFVASLQPVHETIQLTHQGGGKYRGTFTETEASGVYQFVFRMTGNNTNTGPYQRFALRSVVLDFGTADPSGTDFKIVKSDKNAYFQLVPKNKFGHLIGPNRLNQIRVTVNGELVKLNDKLNGQYEAPMPDRSLFNPDPNVEVEIKGASFYDAKFSGIEGNGLTFWDKYRLWLILLIAAILILVLLLRKK